MDNLLLPSSSKLNIGALAQLFNNTSECYKFFWFQAILNSFQNKGANTENPCLSFDSLVNEMIVNAWFMVNEYHLNLGPVDNLEKVVKYLDSINNLPANAKKEKLREAIAECEDQKFIAYKRELIKNVPYRLQAPFMSEFKGASWHVGVKKLIEQINSFDGLIYRFGNYDGLNTCIRIEDGWFYYLKEHNKILNDWLRYNLLAYLERRNPGVPGIINKLDAPEHRDLVKIKDFWKVVMCHIPVYEIYSHKLLAADEMSIDHFVPFSYVSHDEFWNLSPTTRNINSSKNNNLPEWDTYFECFCRLHYEAYKLKKIYPDVKKSFNVCADKHFNDMNVRKIWEKEDQSFVQFEGALEEVMHPVYNSAKRLGFGMWNDTVVSVKYEVPELALKVAEEREQW